jgi:hypothetical protein
MADATVDLANDNAAFIANDWSTLALGGDS